MVYWVGISVAFIPKGYLVRLTDATMPSEVSVRNQRIYLHSVQQEKQRPPFL